MYLEGLDEVDQTIITLLTKNARMSYVDIGEAVGLSRVAVKARISALVLKQAKSIQKKGKVIIRPRPINKAYVTSLLIRFFFIKIHLHLHNKPMHPMI